MKSGKWHRRYNPIFVGTGFIDQNNNYCNDHKYQQQAPALSHMDHHFIQVVLNKITADNKWNNQQV